jgi:hypothetical protein
MRITEYRVVETSAVTDEALTRILNHETRAGWVYDGMTFVPNEASKRPRMAFIIFTREADVDDPSPASDHG